MSVLFGAVTDLQSTDLHPCRSSRSGAAAVAEGWNARTSLLFSVSLSSSLLSKVLTFPFPSLIQKSVRGRGNHWTQGTLDWTLHCTAPTAPPKAPFDVCPSFADEPTVSTLHRPPSLLPPRPPPPALSPPRRGMTPTGQPTKRTSPTKKRPIQFRADAPSTSAEVPRRSADHHRTEPKSTNH